MKPHGIGRLITEDGHLYEGQFLDGKLNGLIRCIYKNESWEFGYWKNSKVHGYKIEHNNG